MKSKILNALEWISGLLDIIASFIFDVTFFLLATITMGVLTFISFKFNTVLGITVLIISLSWFRVGMR